MDLKKWRLTQQLTLSECADRLRLVNARTYQRYETGENRTDADIAERILAMTKGQVTVGDLHQMRLDWLRGHRPDKFQEAVDAV
ncbi:helix-turn-helix domain-containing protein [Pseudochrobactrum asaccharolyticum]|nr:helix-turn-helix domain-containing protein [Pseudochrobactrum asaccharolyticum]